MADTPEPGISQDPVTPTPQAPVTPEPTPATPPKEFTPYEKQLFERNKKLEQEIAELKKPQTPETPASVTPEKAPVADFETIAGFVQTTKDLSREELAELTSEAKSLGLDPMRYLASKAGKAHLAEFRKTNTSTSATPSPSNNVKLYNGKPADDVLRDPNASPAEKQKAMEAKLKKGPSSSA